MAKYNIENYTAADGLGFPLNFRRGNPNPLDNSSVWASLAAAQNYAANDPVAYVGQILTVVNKAEDGTTSVVAYSIQDEAGTLKEVGSTPVADGLTVEIVDGKIQLKGADGAETGAQPRMKADGSIEWIVPSTDTVDGLQTAVAGLQSDVSDLQDVVGDTQNGLVKDVADNAAAITAVEEKIGAVTEGKTVVEMIADAQREATYDDTDLAGRVTAIEGDYLKAADKTALEAQITAEATQAKTDAIAAIMGEAGIDEKYDTLKEIADWILSDTTNSAELITRVSNIEADYLKGADKTALQSDIDALEALVGALPEDAVSTNVVAYIQEVVDGLKIGDYAKVADLTALTNRVKALEDVGAEKNIIATVDEAQFNIDENRNLTLLDIAMGKVAGLNDALAGKVDAEDGKRLMTDAEGTKLAGIAEGAQVNVIDSIDTAQFAIDAQKNLTLLDIAMGKVIGLQAALDNKVDKVEGSRLITTSEAAKLEALVLGDGGQVEISGKVNADNVEGLDEKLNLKVDKATGKSLVDDTLIAKLEAIEADAQVNKIEAVKVGDTLLDIVDKAVIIPVGAGLKASKEVTIASDGALGIGEVNVNKLVQNADDILILNGGAAV